MLIQRLTFVSPAWIGILAGAFSFTARETRAAAYQDAVLALKPSFYYELNETSTAGGVIDSTGHAAPGSYNGDYVNGPAMVGGPGPLEVNGGQAVPGVGGAENHAHYSNNAGHIILGPGENYGANSITVALFLKAGGAQGGDRVFTNNLTDPTKSFQIVTANDGLVLAVDPGSAGVTAERTLFLEDNSGPDRRLIDSNAGWFHVVASTHGATGAERAGNFRIWINGVDRTENLQPNSTGWGVDTEFAKIGGRRVDPLDSTTHSGAQDEVAIWKDRVLTDAEVESLWSAARPFVSNYAKAVIRMQPDYYYRLDEKDTAGGVIDEMGNAAPGSYNGDYVNGPPMVGGPGALEVFGGLAVPGLGGAANVAHYSNNAGHILLGPSANYGSKTMSVALFLKAGGAQGGDRVFTNNLADPTTSFQIVTANDGLVLAVDPNSAGEPAERTLYLEDNSGPDRRLIDSNAGWFHVIATTHGETGAERAGNFRLWINGVDRTENLKPNSTGWGIDTEFAKIGGRRVDPLDSTTHSGAQDEVAIWIGQELTPAQAAALWSAATTTSDAPGIRGIVLKKLIRHLNGTPDLKTDDAVDFTVTVSGTGIGSDQGWVVSGPPGSSLLGQTGFYGAARAFTSVPISDFAGGSMVLTVKDSGDPTLTGTLAINVPETIMDWSHTWDYMNPMGVFPPSPGADVDTDFDTTWYLKASEFATRYDGPVFGGDQVIGDPNTPDSYDSGSGPGPLGYDSMDYWGTPGALFNSHGTFLSTPLTGLRYTTYARTTFTVPNDGRTYNQPVLTYLMDDGGFVYLDGELIMTVNMLDGVADTYMEPAANGTDTENQLRVADLTQPAGSPTGALATTGAKNAVLKKSIPVLTPGTHTLAVSVHNAAMDSSDQGFALQLTSTTSGGGTGGETDSDGDGVSDAAETIMGTNPNNSTDVLRLTQAATPGQMQFPSKAGKYYRVYTSPDLHTWTPSAAAIPGDGSVKQFPLAPSAGTPRLYYRLHVMSMDGPWAP